MGLFNRKPSLDELFKILETLSDEDKQKIRERFFDAEREEVKEDASEELAEVDTEEGEEAEAKAEEEQAAEEQTESDKDEGEVMDEVDESVGEKIADGEEPPVTEAEEVENEPVEEPAPEPDPVEASVETEEEKDRAAAYDARFKALEESIAALTEKLTALLDNADYGKAFGASAVGNYEDKEENGDRAVMASYNKHYRG